MEIKKIRIVLVHIHGLLRGEDLELGKDSDTGGQTKYVLELAKSLTENDSIEEVTILTRQIIDKNISKDYSIPVERVNDKLRIVRIECGPRRYLRKESLWIYLYNFIDKSLNYIKREGKIPHIIHGHYADGGLVGSQLANLLHIPFIFTGHSLGRIKKQRLIDSGKDLLKINTQYKINQRIEAEEIALDSASIVITSTQQEVEEQYSLYEQYQPGNMEVIPPGVDLEKFQKSKNLDIQLLLKRMNITFSEPNKPVILAIARPDEKKNLGLLLKIYGKSEKLKELANMVIIAGSRDKLADLEANQRNVISDLFTIVDDYNLYGKVAYPKQHTPEDIPQLYQWAMEQKGVFINPALTEPFGLTLLESSACGLPVIATNDGGPRDILAACNSGLLIDPLDEKDIERNILRLLMDKELWSEFSSNALKNTKVNYSWQRHSKKYLELIFELLDGFKPERFDSVKPKKVLPNVDRLIITDIDNTLTGDDEALTKFIEYINNTPDNVGFGVATGRSKESALKLLEEIGVPKPQLLICSVGTEIYYGDKLIKDLSWEKTISSQNWDKENIINILNDVDGLKLQDESSQSQYKISYIMDTKKINKLGIIRRILRNNYIKARVVLSMGCFLDILPIRSGDGLAMRQISFKWGIPWDKILVVGDSGNDESMLMGETLGVVVSNYSKELDKLRKYPRVFFAKGNNAWGIIEGIEYYNFLGDIRIPNNYYDK